MAYGWSSPAATPGRGVTVARFEDGAIPDVLSFATFGLSRVPALAPSGKIIRQELLMSVTTAFGERNIPGLLQGMAATIHDSKSPVLHGDVLRVPDAALRGTDIHCFYSTYPVYFDDDFAVCESPLGAIVVVWLVPISDAEADLVWTSGWQALEDAFESHGADLLNPGRKRVA